ncbi:hypothetical protein NF27_FH00010 [Candidatus Jidaibacter acanthamoeba]|uniref:Uncharacterized protein n=1 Tax=Candidatus Jidaibacter acanthamoebae TaxID=86105 RepID=A0A0C1QL90_9RICK|nr:hypothetical protein NF27_FH00010 [Candidatus Jidaibacter acanthamoeba]
MQLNRKAGLQTMILKQSKGTLVILIQKRLNATYQEMRTGI